MNVASPKALAAEPWLVQGARMLRRSVCSALWVIVFAAGCGGSNDASPTGASASASAVSRASATPSAVASASTVVPAPVPLGSAAQREAVLRACAGFTAAVDKHSAEHPGVDAEKAIVNVSQNPPAGLSAAEVFRCREVLLEDARANVFKALALEILGQAATRLATTPKAKPCPSAKPIPADATKAVGYRAQPADWDDAGWKCLGGASMTLAKGALPGQIEYRLAADGVTLEGIARRAPSKPGERVIAYVAKGTIDKATGQINIASDVESW